MSCFFNPLSTKSGIKRQKNGNRAKVGEEIIDKSILENIQYQFTDPRSVSISGMSASGTTDLFLFSVYFSLIGDHYYLQHSEDKGAKGVLDLLIFPLIARKLLTDSRAFINNEKNYECANSYNFLEKSKDWLTFLLKASLGLALELTRFAFAVSLTSAYLGLATGVLTAAAVIAGFLVVTCAPIVALGYGLYNFGSICAEAIKDLCTIDSAKYTPN